MKTLFAFLLMLFLTTEAMSAAMGEIFTFDDANSISNWTVDGGAWSITPSGTLKHVASATDTTSVIFSPYYWSLGKSLSMEVDVKWLGGGYFQDGIIWGFNRNNSYEYMLAFLSTYKMAKVQPTVAQIMKATTYTNQFFPLFDIRTYANVTQNVWYKLKLEVGADGHSKFYVNNVLIMEKEWTVSEGYVGLGGMAGHTQSAEFDNLTISIADSFDDYNLGYETAKLYCSQNPTECNMKCKEWKELTSTTDIVNAISGTTQSVRGYWIKYNENDGFGWIYVSSDGKAVGKIEPGCKKNGTLRWTTVHNLKAHIDNFSSIDIADDKKSISFGNKFILIK